MAATHPPPLEESTTPSNPPHEPSLHPCSGDTPLLHTLDCRHNITLYKPLPCRRNCLHRSTPPNDLTSILNTISTTQHPPTTPTDPSDLSNRTQFICLPCRLSHLRLRMLPLYAHLFTTLPGTPEQRNALISAHPLWIEHWSAQWALCMTWLADRVFRCGDTPGLQVSVSEYVEGRLVRDVQRVLRVEGGVEGLSWGLEGMRVQGEGEGEGEVRGLGMFRVPEWVGRGRDGDGEDLAMLEGKEGVGANGGGGLAEE